ncbi:hypothetical protein KW787_02045 [Candidatus Pacearchaeota archaeon]|nr:hypothetical protein [Candidatus Pacearchaeota archaeon]
MAKKNPQNYQLKKAPKTQSKHVRLGLQQSPDNPDLGRYTFIIVDRRNPETIDDILRNELVKNISYGGLGTIRGHEGNQSEFTLKMNGYKGIIRTYEAQVNLFTVKNILVKMGMPFYIDPFLQEGVKKPKGMRELPQAGIETYASVLYERK